MLLCRAEFGQRCPRGWRHLSCVVAKPGDVLALEQQRQIDTDVLMLRAHDVRLIYRTADYVRATLRGSTTRLQGGGSLVADAQDKPLSPAGFTRQGSEERQEHSYGAGLYTSSQTRTHR